MPWSFATRTKEKTVSLTNLYISILVNHFSHSKHQVWWHTRRTIRDVWIRNRQVNRRQRETLFVHLFPHDKRLHFYVLYIRELWRNFVTYIVINSLYIMCNQVNFCYEWTGCEKGFREPCLFACLLPNKTSSDARRACYLTVNDVNARLSSVRIISHWAPLRE